MPQNIYTSLLNLEDEEQQFGNIYTSLLNLEDEPEEKEEPKGTYYEALGRLDSGDPQTQVIETEPYASLPRRFFERFAEGLAPFGLYESDLGKPENIGEIVADVAGGLTGFAVGFIPIGLMTGGASVPLKTAGALSKFKNVKELKTALNLVSKAQKTKNTAEAAEYSARAAKILGVGSRLEQVEMAGKISAAMPRASGLLSRVPGYTNFILKTAMNSPKTARAFNAGISNVVSFGIHGQVHVPLKTPVSDRLKQMGADAATGVAFTVAGLPTTLGAKGPWKYAEPVSLFGIGAGSDLGMSDMSPTERIAHGLGLVAFHYGMSGLRKIGIEEKQIRALQDLGYSYEDAYIIARSAKPVNDAVLENVSQAKENLKGFIFRNKYAADENLKDKISVQVEPDFIKRTSKGKFELRGTYIRNDYNPERVGEPFILEGNSYNDVRRQFTGKRRRKDGKGGRGFIIPISDKEHWAQTQLQHDVPMVTDKDKKLAKDYNLKAKRIDELANIPATERGYDIEAQYKPEKPKKPKAKEKKAKKATPKQQAALAKYEQIVDKIVKKLKNMHIQREILQRRSGLSITKKISMEDIHHEITKTDFEAIDINIGDKGVKTIADMKRKVSSRVYDVIHGTKDYEEVKPPEVTEKPKERPIEKYKVRLYVAAGKDKKGKERKDYLPDNIVDAIMLQPELTPKEVKANEKNPIVLKENVEKRWMDDSGNDKYENSANLRAQSELHKTAARMTISPEQAEWRNALKVAQSAKRDQGIEDRELQSIIKDFFPKTTIRGRQRNLSFNASHKLDNMSKQELDAFTSMFSPDTGRRYFDEMVQKAPVDRYWDFKKIELREASKKWIHIIRNKILPFYTELRLLGAKALSKLSMDFELLRQKISGEGVMLYNRLRKMGVKRKDIKLITKEIDPLYVEGLRGELSRKGYDVGEIVKTVKEAMDYNYAYLVASGNEVRVFKKSLKKFDFEPIFELQDSAGNIIELAKPQGETKTFSERFEVRTRKDSVHQGKRYEGDMLPSKIDRVVLQTKDKKKIVINRSDIVDGGLRSEWQSYKDLVVRIASSQGKKNAPRIVVDRFGEKRRINYKNSTIFYEPNYLTRILTPKMRTMIGANSSYRKKLAEFIVENSYDPELIEMKNLPPEAKIEQIMKKLEELNSFQSQKGVFGQQFGRLADLPPVLIQNENGKFIAISPSESRYSGERWGYNVKKGDTVVDVNGKEHTVANTVNVYEHNFERIVNRYQSMVANIVPTYQYVGRGGARNSEFKTKYITGIRAIHGDSIARWVEKGLELQINGQIKSPVANLLNKTTAFTAAIGLSSPLSGVKNILLGQANIIAGFGLRSTLSAYGKLLGPEGRRAWTEIARNIGATEVGVHEMLTTPYSKYSPGLMYPTEITNRIIAATVGDIVLNSSVDALTGRKSPLFSRVSKGTASDFIKQTFKLDPGKIMERGYVTNSERAKALQMAHLFTQGGPSMPFVPPWMQKQMARPLTLFYRIAYRVTDHVVTNVMRPMIVRGNPIPMMRYAGAATLTGGALYSMYYNVMDKEVVNKFKGMPYQYWMQFIKGEGMAILSNGFDQYGSAVETYQPVIFRTYSSLAKNMAYIIAGKKGAVQGTTDWFNENVVIWNHSRQVYRRFAEPYNHAFTKSRKKQRQFLEATFGTGWMAKHVPGDDYLTTRTPYYKDIKDVFWSEDGRNKAKVYYTALAYITHDIERQRASIGKSVHGSRAEARAILKRIISNRRPIPTAWRTRKKGEKTTMYRLYMSALTPDEQLLERELDNMYRRRRKEFNSAMQTYKFEFDHR